MPGQRRSSGIIQAVIYGWVALGLRRTYSGTLRVLIKTGPVFGEPIRFGWTAERDDRFSESASIARLRARRSAATSFVIVGSAATRDLSSLPPVPIRRLDTVWRSGSMPRKKVLFLSVAASSHTASVLSRR